ncbi:hypothetical protein TanjilG_24679 [Lupinus angustifolius]|uniref:Mechanosensitive ion channel protein n=2 Tax=Lupinus angustifolius TaxID=3871 RepID=A0A4P1RKB4_LUPAN|nr:hypothetical protein TanjilG_24679 [Lupinus angustifolius]
MAAGGDHALKINDANPTVLYPSMWRESSYEFWNDDGTTTSSDELENKIQESFHFRHKAQLSPKKDPPSMLIGKFSHNQKASGDFSLDMDLEMHELQHNSSDVKFTPFVEFQRLLKHGRHGGVPSPSGDSEVLKCTSNASFERNLSKQRNSTLLKAKNVSRLLDPPEEPNKKSDRVPRSGQIFPAFVGKKGGDDEEDDPFLEEDLPDEYKKTRFSFWILLEWLSLILIITLLIATLSIPLLRNKNLWQLKLWKWEVMILVLICGRLVSNWVIRIAVFCIERNFILRKRVLYFVYGVKKAVRNCVWLGLILIVWNLLFDKRVQSETNSPFLEYVTKILVCFLVGTLVWLVKTLVVKVLASSFHVSTYFDRIQESLFNQFVIETLSGPPLIELQKAEEEEKRFADEVQKLQNAGVTTPPGLRATSFSTIKSGRFRSGVLQRSHMVSGSLPMKSDDGNVGITIDHLHKLNQKNVSAWNMKRLINIVRYGALTTLHEKILGSINEDENATHIRSEIEAKAAAKKIFLNVSRHGCRYIRMDDLMCFMHKDEVEKTLSLFEGASDSRKISKSALKNWVVNAFRERRALALTLNDTKTAVNNLHRMLNFLVLLIIVIIWLLILGIATTKFLLFVSSQVVLVAFIFGNTCKTVFESIIFLFILHPYDVGDRCEIDGVQMVVEEMNILTTTFLRYDFQKILIPNSVLATKAISNFYRSPDTRDSVEFYMHVSTPIEKISAVKHRIQSYIDNKKEHWYASPFIFLKDCEQLNMIRLAIWPRHKMNFQDMGERFLRRSLLIEEMIKIFQELDLQYRLLPLDISIRNMPTTSDRVPPSWATTTGRV